MVMPGDNTYITGELITPVAIERARASLSAKAAAPWAPARSRRSWSNERYHHFGVHRVQAPELQHDEEPEEVVRAPRDEQVLPVLQEAHGA